MKTTTGSKESIVRFKNGPLFLPGSTDIKFHSLQQSLRLSGGGYQLLLYFGRHGLRKSTLFLTNYYGVEMGRIMTGRNHEQGKLKIDHYYYSFSLSGDSKAELVFTDDTNQSICLFTTDEKGLCVDMLEAGKPLHFEEIIAAAWMIFSWDLIEESLSSERENELTMGN